MNFCTTRQFLAYAADNFGLQLFETPHYRDHVEAALTQADKWHERECPLKAPLMMCFVFMSVLNRSESLANLLKKLLEFYRFRNPGLQLDSVTPEAPIHSRYRLGPEPFRLFYEKQAAEVRPAPSFHGLRVWAVDGSAFNVPDTEKNDNFFGRPGCSRGSTAFPQLHIVTLLDTTTRQTRGAVIQVCNGSDRDGLMTLLDGLEAGDLLLADIGFAACWVFNKCQERDVKVLFRISDSWKPRVIERLGKGDSIVQVTGTVPRKYRGSPTATCRMRMIEYKIGENERVRLLTDLLDPILYPAMELAKLYHARWECELSYDEKKNHLATVNTGTLKLCFRAKRPEGVLQEVYALLGLYNMIRGMMAEAAELHELDPLDISFVETVCIICNVTARYQLASCEEERLQVYLQTLEDIAGTLNGRPRRPRKCPRGVKVKMSKYPLKPGRGGEEPLDLTIELVA